MRNVVSLMAKNVPFFQSFFDSLVSWLESEFPEKVQKKKKKDAQRMFFVLPFRPKLHLGLFKSSHFSYIPCGFSAVTAMMIPFQKGQVSPIGLARYRCKYWSLNTTLLTCPDILCMSQNMEITYQTHIIKTSSILWKEKQTNKKVWCRPVAALA